MENKTIARKLRLLSQLMELHEVNSFKVKSMANAAFKVDKLPFAVKSKTVAELEKIEGIGKSTAAKITELLEKGTIAELDELADKTPAGVMEMMAIKGIGPKKVAIIWRELGIENLGELYYACNENRLVEAKGFGLKTQEDIRKVIEFNMASHGKFLYARVKNEANGFIEQLKAIFPDGLIEFGGEFRRCCEIISNLIIILGSRDQEVAFKALVDSALLPDIDSKENHITGKLPNGLKIEIVCVEKRYFYKELFLYTGDEIHTKEVLTRVTEDIDQPTSEDLIYKKNGNGFHSARTSRRNSILKKKLKITPCLTSSIFMTLKAVYITTVIGATVSIP